MKCAFCRKQADARVDIRGTLIPVCAKHFGNHEIVTPVNIQTEKDCQKMESMINIAEQAGITGGLD